MERLAVSGRDSADIEQLDQFFGGVDRIGFVIDHRDGTRSWELPATQRPQPDQAIVGGAAERRPKQLNGMIGQRPAGSQTTAPIANVERPPRTHRLALSEENPRFFE